MLSNQKRPSYDTMRGYGSIHANNYSTNSNGDNQHNYSNSSGFPGDVPGRGLERRPSKLDQMRADYQKKILKEKEEKLVNMYEENQRKAMGRVHARNGSGGHVNGGAQNNNHGNNSGPSVRDFFNERRRLEQTGAQVPPIDNHYRQTKGYSSPGAWSNRTGSGNSSIMSSAGRDRAQPLAPIKRPSDSVVSGPQANGGNHSTNGNAATVNGNNSGRSGIPQRHSATNGSNSSTMDDNPFKGRPVFVKHKPLPPTSRHGNNYDDDNSNHIAPPPSQYHKQSGLPKYNQHGRKPPMAQRKPQQQAQQQQQQRQVPQRRQIPQRQQQQPDKSSSGGQQKLTDFQKWQLEQNQARENRLKKLNSQKVEDGGEEGDDEEGGYWGHPSARDSSRSGSKTNQSQVTPATSRTRSLDNVEQASDCDEEEEEGEVARLERELLEKIGREQAELERIKEERKRVEDEEKKERELQKKREAAERARVKKEQEEQRKEEERRRKENAEEEKRERQRAEKEEEKRRKEEEKRRKEEEKINVKRQKEEEKRQKEELKQEEKWQREEERRRKEEEKLAYSSHRKGDYYGEDDSSDEDELPPPSPGDTYTVSKPSRNLSSQRLESGDLDEKPVAAGAVSGADYYAQMANSSDAKGSVGSLVSCKVCGRKFAADRLRKHQSACAVVSKPRKTFNMKQKRVEGTELAKYQGKSKKEPPKKKSNWRSQHNQFIESLRYAKKAAEYEKQGKDVRELGPPPAQANPDLVPCPHCGRKFNETAAERHIPRCLDLKTRPPRMKR